MRKILRYVLMILFFSIVALFFTPSSTEATTTTIKTMDELKTAFEGKATIEGNIIKLTDDLVIENVTLNIEISEVVIDFNGKMIECRKSGHIRVFNKATFKDSLNLSRLEWGGVNFNGGSINVWTNAELIINNGKFIDGGVDTDSKLYVGGKLIINDATFSTTRTEPAYEYNYMIRLGPGSECIVNGGEFSHTDTIIYVGGSKYSNNCKLSINGGKFNCLYGDAIKIYTFYPYVDADGNKEVITPKITLNNCNIEAKHTAIGIWGGCTDEEFKDENTQILTILGGTYQSSKQNNGSPLEIRTYADPYTYFNPKDFVLQGGTFETLSDGLGAIRLLGPRKR